MKGIHSSREPRASCELGRSAQTRVASCTLGARNVSQMSPPSGQRVWRALRSLNVPQEESRGSDESSIFLAFMNRESLTRCWQEMDNWRADSLTFLSSCRRESRSKSWWARFRVRFRIDRVGDYLWRVRTYAHLRHVPYSFKSFETFIFPCAGWFERPTRGPCKWSTARGRSDLG